MKKIQKGFTLIELMIVVAIIGILAAVAIPAYQDYIVKAKLSKVVSTLDPVKTALALYFQENGGFPIPAAADVVTGGTGGNSGTTTTVGTFWSSLGFSVFPSIPNEVASMGVHAVLGASGTTASNVALILQLQNIKAGTVDGVLVALSPNVSGVGGLPGSIVPVTNATTNLAGTDTVSGASALQWYYGCVKNTATSTDAVVKNFFKNGSTPMVCA